MKGDCNCQQVRFQRALLTLFALWSITGAKGTNNYKLLQIQVERIEKCKQPRKSNGTRKDTNKYCMICAHKEQKKLRADHREGIDIDL